MCNVCKRLLELYSIWIINQQPLKYVIILKQSYSILDYQEAMAKLLLLSFKVP